mgnify:CR=1 FL=1
MQICGINPVVSMTIKAARRALLPYFGQLVPFETLNWASLILPVNDKTRIHVASY